jgi:SH3 domain protein
MRTTLLETFIFLFSLLYTSNLLAAEISYVTDELLLGLYTGDTAAGKRIRSIESGTPLEVIERKQNYARVRTREGDVGWVKAGFLVKEKPAKMLVTELTRENTALTRTLRETQEKLANPEAIAAAKIVSLKKQVNATGKELKHAKDEIRDLNTRLAETLTELERYKPDPKEYWIDPRWLNLGGAVSLLLGGIIIGMRIVNNRMRRRFYGFRLGLGR